MRLFVALPIPENIKDGLIEEQNKLKGSIADASWVNRENIHITLKFIGETETDLERIKSSIRSCIGENLGQEITVEGTGTFGRPPRVVWAGISKGRESLSDIMRCLDKSLGSHSQEKPVPHITLCRLRSSAKSPLVSSKKAFGSFVASEILLMQSKLSSQGPAYSVVESFRIGSNGS